MLPICIQNTLRQLLILGLLSLPLAAHAEPTHWRDWSEALFNEARQTDKLIMLHVKAPWCAACRKMDAEAWADARVQDHLQQRYVAVRADFDQHPELMQRYRISGVPALVIFDGEGRELIRRSGYLQADWVYWLLAAVADNPSPEAHQ